MPNEFEPKGPKTYFISQKDFYKDPKQLKPYVIGDKITRDNFIDFLIKSFGLSRGKRPVQLMFFRWLKQKYNFDYQKTFEAFKEIGYYEGLSEAEKNAFDDAYKAVMYHSSYNFINGVNMSDPQRKKLEYLDNFSRIRSEDFGEMEDLVNEIFVMSELKTFDDFMKAAAEYFKRVPRQPWNTNNIIMP